MRENDTLPSGSGTQAMPPASADSAHTTSSDGGAGGEWVQAINGATQAVATDVDVTLDIVEFSGSENDWEPETPPLPPADSPKEPPSSIVFSSWTPRKKQMTPDESNADVDLIDLTSPVRRLSKHSIRDDDSFELSQSEDELESSPIPQPRSPSPPPPPKATRSTRIRKATPSPLPSPSPSPPPSPPRKSMFDIQNDDEMQAMYAQLSTIMAGRDANDDDGSKSPGNDAGYASDDSDQDYEAKRARKLMENQALLAQLGLGLQQAGAGAAADVDDINAANGIHQSQEAYASDVDVTGNSRNGKAGKKGRRGRPPKSSPSKRKTSTGESLSHAEKASRSRKGQMKLKIADDGTTTSNPLPGTTHDLAYIDVPPINERRRDDYVYVYDFLIRAPTPPPPPTPSPSPSPPPEKKRRLAALEEKKAGIEARKADREARRKAKEELREERRKRREEADAARAERIKNAPHTQRKIRSSNAGTGDETSCHQCRRKSNEAKMHCTNVGLFIDGSKKQCPLSYCKPCMDIRYGADQPDVEEEIWDPESKDWKCPRCRALCNCSLCLQKNGLDKFVPSGNARSGSLSHVIRGKGGARIHASVKHYLESQGVTQIGKPGVGGAVPDDDEEGKLMAMIAHLKMRLRAKQIKDGKEVPPIVKVDTKRVLGKWSEAGDDDEDEGDDDDDDDGDDDDSSSEEEGDKPPLPAAYASVKRVILRMPSVRPPEEPSVSGSTYGRQQARLSARNGATSTSATTPVVKSNLPKSKSRKATAAPVESQVWVKGVADLSDSDDSDRTDVDPDGDGDAIATRERARNTSEESSLTTLSDWSDSHQQAVLSAIAVAAMVSQQSPHATTEPQIDPQLQGTTESAIVNHAMPELYYDSTAHEHVPDTVPPPLLDRSFPHQQVWHDNFSLTHTHMHSAPQSQPSPWKHHPHFELDNTTSTAEDDDARMQPYFNFATDSETGSKPIARSQHDHASIPGPSDSHLSELLHQTQQQQH